MELHAYLVVWLFSAAGVTFCFPDTDLNGISQVAIVVEDLRSATVWYTNTLGGMLVPKLSASGVFGNSHFYRMFGREIGQRELSGGTVSWEQLGVPDISDSGTWAMRWNMVMFGNVMFQLIQFVNRNNPEIVWTIEHPDGEGAAKVTTQHFALWLQDEVNITEYIQQTRRDDEYRQFVENPPPAARLVYNSFSNLETREQQLAETPAAVTVFGAILSGAGPNRERVEWSLTNDGTGPRRDEHLEPFCHSKSSVPQIIDPGVWKQFRTVPSSLMGIHHTGIICENLQDCDKFYEGVLGAKPGFEVFVVPQFNWFNVEFQDDVFYARDKNMNWADYGIVPLNENGYAQNITFHQFENTYVETNQFLRTGNNGYEAYPLRWQSLSPGFLRSIVTGFGIRDGKNLNTVVAGIEQRSRNLGLSRVRSNKIGPNTQVTSVPFTTGDLQGYNYAMVRGPSDENLMFVEFSGRARAALKEAMERYDAISSRFDTTDIWKRAGFKSDYCCEKFQMCDVGVAAPAPACPPNQDPSSWWQNWNYWQQSRRPGWNYGGRRPWGRYGHGGRGGRGRG